MTSEYDPTIYDAEWFHGLAWQHPWIQKLMGFLVGVLGPFESSLDLGAGDGYWSYVLWEMGCEAYAIEVSELAREVMPEQVSVFVHDLCLPLNLRRRYDLVLCIEVAEHLPPEAADTLCDTIAHHCGRYVLFTAAPPGQGGHGHLNCQPPKYWIDKLTQRGLVYLEDWSQYTQQAWKNILSETMPWLPRNVMIFYRLEA
jgi:hypothetical protein